LERYEIERDTRDNIRREGRIMAARWMIYYFRRDGCFKQARECNIEGE